MNCNHANASSSETRNGDGSKTYRIVCNDCGAVLHESTV